MTRISPGEHLSEVALYGEDGKQPDHTTRFGLEGWEQRHTGQVEGESAGVRVNQLMKTLGS
jgi:hypothetical protein